MATDRDAKNSTLGHPPRGSLAAIFSPCRLTLTPEPLRPYITSTGGRDSCSGRRSHQSAPQNLCRPTVPTALSTSSPSSHSAVARRAGYEPATVQVAQSGRLYSTAIPPASRAGCRPPAKLPRKRISRPLSASSTRPSRSSFIQRQNICNPLGRFFGIGYSSKCL